MANAGTAQAIARAPARPAVRDLSISKTVNAAVAATHTHAFVAVTHASAASSAASFMRPRTAASAPAMRRAVSRGSATAEPEVKRKTGLSTSSPTARRACRTLGASA